MIFKLLFYAFLIYIATKIYKIYRLYSVVKKQQQEAFAQHHKSENKKFNSQPKTSNKDNHGGDYIDYEEVK